MKVTRIVKVDPDGRVMLPAAIREKVCMNGEDELSIECSQDGTLTLKKVNDRMRFERWLSE
ncbi:MAG: AbrB/MazE/SpoVT family DNA-binding domain-containing protein [Methanothrix sp.]|nr:AbrB/MazE/SpoVT family DNA-binding domain-containing protein [Methanothrix sp.]